MATMVASGVGFAIIYEYTAYSHVGDHRNVLPLEPEFLVGVCVMTFASSANSQALRVLVEQFAASSQSKGSEVRRGELVDGPEPECREVRASTLDADNAYDMQGSQRPPQIREFWLVGDTEIAAKS
ncbi:hypothetical protein [Caballeronia arvi]|uniref:hypothetical protein n=1 Tax=Caballeronia arvi TaxID=1777135 RepID=UPI00190ECEA2|nr:hypothetical protein [Caballeronia arvi]